MATSHRRWGCLTVLLLLLSLAGAWLVPAVREERIGVRRANDR